ncbi:winged helix-turn-helix domain-containing protein [Algibacillus agarilyticus]|uniref:winged helix-turn-helix domain-containing protein n=1 Tax=Algibacillus agarilyticus TaxID=2234133 RepID=UPI001300A4BB|nr:winged helix-turn-helix domain-containing protein [Algibacillus agarilyticus]
MLYRIGKYLYDQDKKLLVADGELSITLKPKQAALLNVFIADPTRWYTSTELLDLVWQKQVVENSSLYLQITNLRKQFGADAIENEKNKGYRFCLTVAEVGDTEIPVHFSDVKKRNRMIAIVLLVLFMFVFGVVSLPNAIDEEAENSKPQAITFMKGQEVSPTVSENYMAFSHRKDGNEFFSIYLQDNRIGAKPIEVLSATDVHDYYYPYINEAEDKLYYLRVDVSNNEKAQCKIFYSTLTNFILSKEKEVADCGNSDWVSPFAVTTDESSLFYAYSNSSSSPAALYKTDLRSGYFQQISLPNQSNYGDYNLALSGDDKFLAFSRLNSDGSSTVMSINLELGTTDFVDRVLDMVNLITWQQNKIVYSGLDKQINYFDILNKEKGSLSIDSSHPIYDGQVKNGFFYFSQGQITVSDIISTPDFGGNYFDKVASPFTDELMQCNELQCYFISDRTGLNQIFKENMDGSITQLSEFKQNLNVSYLAPDPDNIYIYYISNGTLFRFDINLAKSFPLLVGQNISSVAAGCKASEFYVTRSENNVSNLYQITDDGQNPIALLAEQVKVDCSVSEPYLYYLHSQSRDLHRMNLNSFEQLVWINMFDTPSSLHWDVYQNEIIRLKGFYEISHWKSKVMTGSHYMKIPFLTVGYGSKGELNLKYTFAGEMTVYKQKIRFTSD